MQYVNRIIPLYEAYLYFSARFSPKRISDSVKSIKAQYSLMPKFNWTYGEQIVKLEHDLDVSFPENDIMRFYFSPLETNHKEHLEQSLSIGGMLLCLMRELEGTFSFDSFEELIKSKSSGDLFSLISGRYLSGEFMDPESKCDDLTSFIKLADGIFSNSTEKWNLVNAAIDPIYHLARIRPLVSAVAEYIEQNTKAVSSLLSNENSVICDLKELEIDPTIAGVTLPNTVVSNTNVYPSLFALDLVCFDVFEERAARIIIGCLTNSILSFKSVTDNLQSHVSLLKVLSDETRIKALIEMRNRQSYGQELAERTGGKRNAMYYHLEKLMASGLVVCTPTEYRTLFTMNKKAIYDKLTALRDFLTDGWRPGDEDKPEEE